MATAKVNDLQHAVLCGAGEQYAELTNINDHARLLSKLAKDPVMRAIMVEMHEATDLSDAGARLMGIEAAAKNALAALGAVVMDELKTQAM
jgi:hypothetical protein